MRTLDNISIVVLLFKPLVDWIEQKRHSLEESNPKNRSQKVESVVKQDERVLSTT